jgi:DNA adenine methylase
LYVAGLIDAKLAELLGPDAKSPGHELRRLRRLYYDVNPSAPHHEEQPSFPRHRHPQTPVISCQLLLRAGHQCAILLFSAADGSGLPATHPEEATMTPPLKRHGGKNAFNGKLARRIVSLMPPHVHYVEPYAGGLAVLLAKDPDGVSEVANDLHADLTTFWRVLQDPSPFERFRRIAEAMPFSETEYQDSQAGLQSGLEADPVRRAVWFFVACRQSLAGRMDGFAPLSKTRTRRGMNEQASAWTGAVHGLTTVHARLRRVAILNRQALDVIRGQDGPATLFYCDPPYPHDTRTATKVYGAHEMTEADHRELLAVLLAVKGKVMLSGYPSALYDEALAGWTRHAFDLHNNAAGGKVKARETEVLWCNF